MQDVVSKNRVAPARLARLALALAAAAASLSLLAPDAKASAYATPGRVICSSYLPSLLVGAPGMRARETGASSQRLYWKATWYEERTNGLWYANDMPLFHSDVQRGWYATVWISDDGEYLFPGGLLNGWYSANATGHFVVVYTYWWWDQSTGWSSDKDVIGSPSRPIQC